MKKYLPIAALLILLAAAAWPEPAHAFSAYTTMLNWLTGSAKTALESILSTMLELADAFQVMLIRLLAWQGDNLHSFLQTPLSSGGPAVYAVWKVIRDMCNMVFLLLLIAISFGTIFNTLKTNPFHWRGAFFSVLIAAVAINFSLAVGQTIVELGNVASTRVMALFGGKNIGLTIGDRIGIADIVQNGPTIAGLKSATSPSLAGALNAQQAKTAKAWGAAGLTGATKELSDCLVGNKLPTPQECFIAAKILADAQLRVFQDAKDISQGIPLSPIAEVTDFNNKAQQGAASRDAANKAELLEASGGATNSAKSTIGTSIRLGTSILQLFMLLALNLSFLFAIVFMVGRLPVIWLLLAVSAGAFLAIGIPQSKVFKQWLNNIFGWSIFGPIYLLNIYIGLYLLGKQNTLLGSLSFPGADLPGTAGISSLLFFFISCAFFTFGAAWSLKFAFGFITVGAGALKGTASYFGMDAAGGYGLKTTAKLTGLASRYEGAKAGLGSVYQRTVSQPLARRDEDIRARYQARFGDPRALERLNRTRVDEDIKSKKYKTVDDATGALAKLSPKGREYLLKELERNDPILASRMAATGYYLDKNGSRLVGDQVLARNATRMSTEDWSGYLEDVVKRDTPMSPEMQSILQSKVRRPDQLAQLRASTSNAAVLTLINTAVASGPRGGGGGAGPRAAAPRNVQVPGGTPATPPQTTPPPSTPAQPRTPRPPRPSTPQPPAPAPAPPPGGSNPPGTTS